jgi:protein-disulfide isomerase
MESNEDILYEEPTETKNDPAIVINRSTYHLLVVSLVFFLVGIVVGAVGYSQYTDTNEQLIQRVVNEALLLQEGQITKLLGEISTEPVGPNARDYIDDDPSIGREDAPIVIVEFSDFNCQYCKRFMSETLQPLLEAYGDDMLFVYRDFTILGPSSIDAAVAAECANEQDSFWEYHDILFDNQARFSRDELIGYAEGLNLDIEAFSVCLDDPEFLSEVRRDTAAAQQIGARGTPAFLVNGQMISGAQPFEAFAAIIDQELALASDS